MNNIRIFFMVLMIGISSHASADQNEIERLKRECNGTEASACHALGFMYSIGTNDVNKDIQKAKDYYSKACDKGFSISCKSYQNLAG